MSEVKFTASKNRLAKAMRLPGGTTVRGALKDAGRNLETIRKDCLADIDVKLAEIEQRFGQAKARPSDDDLDDLYRLSNAIVGTAGLFDRAELGEAAFSLCDLIDRLRTAERWDGPAVALHLSALRLLRHAASGLPQNDAVLAGLRALTAHVDGRR